MRTTPRLGPLDRRPSGIRPGNARLPLALRHRPDPAPRASADPLARSPELARVEAALLMADEPLAARRLADVAGVADAAAARELVARLDRMLEAGRSAFRVEEVGGGYQLLTRPVYHPWLARLERTGPEVRLTPAVLETLAVVAYRQPVTRAEVEAVRGVGCAEAIRQLMEKGLVRTAGRHPSLGRPQVYATTRHFLRAFGLNTLADLPAAATLRGGRL